MEHVSQETDEQKLKAMAYDEMRQAAVHQQNLRVLEVRLGQLTDAARPGLTTTRLSTS
jgi:hypothetical protein